MKNKLQYKITNACAKSLSKSEKYEEKKVNEQKKIMSHFFQANHTKTD